MTMSEEAREERIQQALMAWTELDTKPTHSILFRGKQTYFPVVEVPLDVVLYNPRSHRIKAHLEDRPDSEEIAANPYAPESQHAIAEILRSTEGYTDLKNNLADVGQRDPGVVTRTGLLINANTRLAALREIEGVDHIELAVLPTDTDEADIDRVELDLQIKKDFKQDYTFTNFLLFVHDLIEHHGYSDQEIAKLLNLAASSDPSELSKGVKLVKKYVRILALLREIQSRGSRRIPLTFFDDKRQALDDLDDALQDLVKKDPAQAEVLKVARIAGILVGAGYRELRKINPRSVDDHLVAILDEKEALKGRVTKLHTEPTQAEGGDGDADLLDDEDMGESAGPTLEPLVDVLIDSHGSETATLPSPSDGETEEVDRKELVKQIAEAIDETAESVNADQRAKNDLNGPAKMARAATKNIENCLEAYKTVKGDPSFKSDEFGTLMEKLEEAYEALTREAA